MSISIIANLAANTRGEASQTGTLAALLSTSPELPLDFSALLKDQLTRQPIAKLGADEKASAKLADEARTPSTLLDQALSLAPAQATPTTGTDTTLPLTEHTPEITAERSKDKLGVDQTTPDLSLLAQLTVANPAPPITTKTTPATTELTENTILLENKEHLAGDLAGHLQSQAKTANSATRPDAPPLALAETQQAKLGAQDGKAVLPGMLNVANNALPANSDKPATLLADALKSGLMPATKPEPAILAGDNATTAPSAPQPSSFSALLANQTNNSAQQPGQAVQLPVNTPLHTPRWNADFGERIVWMAKNDQQSAQISINPAQLGPVQITLNLHGDQASAVFASPHAEVRQAIQDAMPQLREMLASSGISLGQANVGAQLPQQNREATQQFANTNRSSGENAILSPDSLNGSISANLPLQRGRGLVDLFA